MLRLLITVVLFYLSGLWASAQPASQKVALLIGNAEYEHVPALRNPSNDASDIAAALDRLGFDVVLLLDQDDTEMRRAIRDFAQKAKDAELTILYFAGHGIEINKTNYLIPVNAELRSDQDAEFEAIELGSVLRTISGGQGVNLVLVDACRDNPFASRLIQDGASRSIGSGLVRVDPVGGVLPGGVLISYAAREGTFALDGVGRNSPYAQGLLEQLEVPGLEVSKLFRRVRDRVFVLTGGQQEPFTYGSLPGIDIYLRPPLEQLSLPVVDRNLVKDFAAAEREDTVGSWRDFLSKHGDRTDHELVQIAKRRLNVLRGLAFANAAVDDKKLWLKPSSGTTGSGPVTLSLEERKLVQKSLSYLGMDVGVIDGQFGPQTRRAISSARLRFGLISGTHVDLPLLRLLPNAIAIDALRSTPARSFEEVAVSELQEPRLETALRGLGNRRAVFDYHEGRLYFAVLGSAHDFGLARGNALARAMGGHLATISNRAEDAFIFDLFQNDNGFLKSGFSDQTWGVLIGLYRPTDQSGNLGEWTWVTGEPVTYSNWSPGTVHRQSEANFIAAYFLFEDASRSQKSKWRGSRGSTNRFIIEIE